MVQPRETYVDGQHHPQQELVDGHHARNAVNGQSFFNQFLEAQLLQHGRYGKQTTIGRKILGTEVKRRGSSNLIGLRTICRKALFGTGFLDMLLFVLHHLGDPLEVEFVKPASFANSFLPHVFGVPKWFLQIRALPKPTPVHYSGITYAALGNNINAFQQTTTVQDGAGHTLGQTTNNYDEVTPTATSGTPQHVAVSGSRGNLTSTSQIVQTTSSTSVTSHLTYYDTGEPNTSTDVNGAVTTFNYSSGSCGNSFPTSISEPLNMSRSMAWNCTGGVLTSLTDENQHVTSTTYNDPFFWRPASTNSPDGGQTSLTYNSP